jgi:hypothetical protein
MPEKVRLSFERLTITLRTTRFKMQKFYMVLTLRLCVMYELTTNSDFCLAQPWQIGFV